MAAEFELTDEMRAVIGVESEPWLIEVTTTSIRAFARGVGHDDLRYYEEDEARAAGHDALLPPSAIDWRQHRPRPDEVVDARTGRVRLDRRRRLGSLGVVPVPWDGRAGH